MKRPCGSCPYRRDVPSGIWDASEYDKLPGYDRPTFAQPPAAFFCHQQNGELCSGWVGCHDMDESFGLRMAATYGLITREQATEALAYESPVPLFSSGAEAAEHGLAELDSPSERTRRAVARLTRKLDLKTNHHKEDGDGDGDGADG